MSGYETTKQTNNETSHMNHIYKLMHFLYKKAAKFVYMMQI